MERYRQRLHARWAEIRSNKERQDAARTLREEYAQKAAQSFLSDLTGRAQFREAMRMRGQEEKRLQEEILKRQAEAYRLRLRQYLYDAGEAGKEQ